MLTGLWSKFKNHNDEPIRTRATAGSKESHNKHKKLETLEKHPGTEVPEIIFKITEHLDRHITVEGLYRKTGNRELVLKLTAMDPKKIQYDKIDVHDLASFLKTLLISLEEPLLPKEMFDDYKGNTDRVVLESALQKLDDVRKATLELLMRHLLRVIDEVAKNKMSKKNICMVWAPVFYYPLESHQEADECFKFSEDLLDIYAEQSSRRTTDTKSDDADRSESAESESASPNLSENGEKSEADAQLPTKEEQNSGEVSEHEEKKSEVETKLD